MNIIERIDRPCEYVEVAQTALIACQYLYLWLFAGPDDAYKVYSLAILMAFEFVMVHSGLFMAAMSLKASIRLFIPLYGLLHLHLGIQCGRGIIQSSFFTLQLCSTECVSLFSMSVNRSSSG